MHWCAYPSPTHSLTFRLRNSKTKSARTIFNYVLENIRHDWQNIKMATRKTSSKSAFTVPSPKRKRFTDTEAQMDINGR